MSKPISFPFDVEKFFQRCVKSKTIPKNDFEKQAILMKLVAEFGDKTKYSEQEVNLALKKFFEDYTLLRRELVNFGYMQRNPTTGEYWVVKRDLTEEDLKKNTLLRNHSKAYMGNNLKKVSKIQEDRFKNNALFLTLHAPLLSHLEFS